MSFDLQLRGLRALVTGGANGIGWAACRALASQGHRVAVADIGAGTIDLTLFADGSPFHTAVLPVGGNNVTSDIATGLIRVLDENGDAVGPWAPEADPELPPGTPVHDNLAAYVRALTVNTD